MTKRAELTVLLDALEASLPQLINDNPDDGDFWMAFAGQADLIEDEAGEHRTMVIGRIEAMLMQHGRYLATVAMDEPI